MSDTNSLTASLLIEIPKRFPLIRVWRQNTGSGVGMNQVRRAQSLIRANDHAAALRCLARPMTFGVLGGGDLSGIVGPEGTRLEIEVKAGTDQQSEEQKGFQAMVLAAGGIYIVARSVEQTLEDLGRWL